MSAWLSAFVATQLIEAPLYAAWPLRDRPLGCALALGFVASAVTHPVVWFVFPRLIDTYWPMVAAAETFAVLVEAGWLRMLGARPAFLASLVVNAVSVGLGLLSRHLFGWP